MNETGEIKGVFMLGKLRNMTSIYLFRRQEVLLLFRQGSRVVTMYGWGQRVDILKNLS